MVSQRKSHQPEGNGGDHPVPIRESRRGRNGDSRQPPISGLENIINGFLKKDLDSCLEPFLRRLVREEVERKIREYLIPRASPCQGGTSGAKPLELRFINKPPETIFTLSNVIAEDEETPLQIALFDVRSQSVVSTGPLSSTKVEIFALNGELFSQRCEDCTEEEFNANVLTQREGKEPLLNGDRILTLKNGVGCISKIKFTDNSSWTRSRKFSLGAKALQLTSCGASIKEGVSKPFVVKDNRGELYKKHHPPHLEDDVWRLEKIAKNGIIYRRLCDHGIRTVGDLMRSYIINPSSLHEKVGKIPTKSWVAITEHAKECVIDDYNLYMYHAAEQPVGLLFNSIYILVGVTFDGQNYYSPDALAPNERGLVEMMKQHAYKNLGDLKSVGDQTHLNFPRSRTYLQAWQASGPDQGLQQLNFPIAQQGVYIGSYQPYAVEGMQNDQVYASPFPDLAPMLQNSSAEGELFPGMQTDGHSWPHIGSTWTEYENPHIQSTNWGQENGLHFNPYGGAELGSLSNGGIARSEKPRAVWYKIRTALKWVISVRRDAVARRMAKLIYYNY
ncbi:calmodulin-binding protein 60 B-like isoform X2 [Prosopis cineraria]|uniref:calmodulin-binding protein 60 B-like isoform X2 n=1 Tax=Prosopis cineraria TaxID=364024 RepID=UPI0024101FA8|nr:calmodulin-binding protein 60 B-like isoform X2 [Prosopis cineraria]